MRAIAMLWVAMAAPAVAGTPVVFDGPEAGSVLEAVAARSGLPLDQLDPVSLDDLLKAAPASLGEAVLRRCTRDGTRNDLIRTQLSRAEAALAGDDRISGLDFLDLAVAELGCLLELPDRKVTARVFLVRGALLAEEDPEAARGELRTALAFDPELAWDERYGEPGRFLLEEVRAAGASATLAVVPDTATSGPWIDGVEAPDTGVRVGAGLHLAQYSGPTGVASAWLLVGGDCTLVLPGAYRRPVLEHMLVEAERGQVEALLAGTIPDLNAAYVSVAGGLWLVAPDGAGVSTIEIAPPGEITADAEPDDGKKKKKDKKKK